MKRFARILIATAGLAAASTPAIFAEDFHNSNRGRDNGERTVVIRRETVQTYERGFVRDHDDLRHRDAYRDRDFDRHAADRFRR